MGLDECLEPLEHRNCFSNILCDQRCEWTKLVADRLCPLCRFTGLPPYEAAAWSNDNAFLSWAEGSGAIVIATELKVKEGRMHVLVF